MKKLTSVILLFFFLTSCHEESAIKYELPLYGRSVYNTLEQNKEGLVAPKYNSKFVSYDSALNVDIEAYYYKINNLNIKSFLAFSSIYPKSNFISFSNDTIDTRSVLIVNVFGKNNDYKIVHNGNRIIKNDEHLGTKVYYILPQKLGIDTVKIMSEKNKPFEFKFFITDNQLINKDSLILFSNLPKDVEPF